MHQVRISAWKTSCALRTARACPSSSIRREVYPLDGLHRYAEMGADLFGYGAKYFGAPNSTGLLCGREDLIRSALAQLCRIRKARSAWIGRPFKVDRQEVFGVTAALRRWLSMDHDERFETARKRAENLVRHLEPLTAVQIEQRASTVEVRCAEKRARSVADIAQALRDGHPLSVARRQAPCFTPRYAAGPRRRRGAYCIAFNRGAKHEHFPYSTTKKTQPTSTSHRIYARASCA